MSRAPKLTPDQLATLRAKLREVETRTAERSLAAFVRLAWHIVEPDTPLVWNWHLDLLCAHYEAIARGDASLKNVIVNIPPGCMKSLLGSVFWPAWTWIAYPSKRWLFVSYDQTLSTRDNLKCRQIVESSWYQERWGHRVQLADDQNEKTRYNTNKGGWRIGTSIGGAATGEHPDIKVVDDPHNVKGSLSDEKRKEAIRFISLTLPSRGASRKAATVVTMQRLHQEDVSGYLLQSQPDRWVHICLPMEYEPPTKDPDTGQMVPRMTRTPLGWNDPRTEPGQLLWPDLFPKATVDGLSREMGAFGTAGQFQQRPVPEKGGIFRREKFWIVDALPADAHIIAVGRGWDGAASENQGDYTAGVLMALTADERIFIIDVVRGQLGPDESEMLLASTTTTDALTYGKAKYRIRGEQEGGSAGKKVAKWQTQMLAGYDFKAEPSTGDKVTRARPLAAQQIVGNVYLLRAPWNKPFIDELAMFPSGINDDQVDAATRIYNDLKLEKKPVVRLRKLSGW